MSRKSRLYFVLNIINSFEWNTAITVLHNNNFSWADEVDKSDRVYRNKDTYLLLDVNRKIIKIRRYSMGAPSYEPDEHGSKYININMKYFLFRFNMLDKALDIAVSDTNSEFSSYDFSDDGYLNEKQVYLLQYLTDAINSIDNKGSEIQKLYNYGFMSNREYSLKMSNIALVDDFISSIVDRRYRYGR